MIIATSTVELSTVIMGNYLVSSALGVVLAGIVWIVLLLLKRRRGGAYADFANR